MKKLTYGAINAIMILAAQRMGLEPRHLDDAKRELEGGAIHPITGAAIGTEASDLNNRLRHDASLIAKANIHADHIQAEYGFPIELSKEAFLALQAEAELLGLAHAKGQDLPEHAVRLQTIGRIMNEAPWTLHPDHGCILKSEVNEKDLAAL